MKTEVLVERIEGNRFRVTGSGRFALTLEGDSRDEALHKFQCVAAESFNPIAEVVILDIPLPFEKIAKSDSWAWFAGWLKDDPYLEAYKAEIEKARQEDDENEARKLAEETPKSEDGAA